MAGTLPTSEGRYVTEPIFDRDRRCPKCGASATMEYRAMREWGFGYASPLNRILRRCERCAHSWYELPLDYDEETEREMMKAYLKSREEQLA